KRCCCLHPRERPRSPPSPRSSRRARLDDSSVLRHVGHADERAVRQGEVAPAELRALWPPSERGRPLLLRVRPLARCEWPERVSILPLTRGTLAQARRLSSCGKSTALDSTACDETAAQG